MEKKMTKAEMFLEAAMLLGDMNETGDLSEIIEMLEMEATRVDKRNASRRTTETKAQKENRHIAALVLDFFFSEADAEIAYNAAEIVEAVGLEGISTQKMTAVMKILDGDVEKVAKSTSNKARVGYQVKLV